MDGAAGQMSWTSTASREFCHKPISANALELRRQERIRAKAAKKGACPRALAFTSKRTYPLWEALFLCLFVFVFNNNAGPARPRPLYADLVQTSVVFGNNVQKYETTNRMQRPQANGHYRPELVVKDLRSTNWTMGSHKLEYNSE